MNHTVKIEDAYNLLLNLLCRETTNWYFMDIVPQHDKQLAKYMCSVANSTFLRFDLHTSGSILYIPLSYRSLTGMHIFSHEIGIRHHKYGEVFFINYTDAVLILLNEIYPSITSDELKEVINEIENKYETLVKSQIQTITPSSIPYSARYDIGEKSNSILSSQLITEYAEQVSAHSLSKIITYYANHKGTSIEQSAINWVKQYTSCLLNSTFNSFFKENVIVSPQLQFTEIELDEDLFPIKLDFHSECLILSQNDLPDYFPIEKLQIFLQQQLLVHHIFPLIRNVGLLSFAQEEVLLDSISSLIENFCHDAGSITNYLLHSRTNVNTYLNLLFTNNIHEINYSSQQVHIHNHLVNKKYYSSKLIKPNPGEMVHKRYFNGGTIEIGIRGFNIETDLEILHQWVNEEYAKKFWEMDGPIENLEEAYIKHLGVDYSHPYIGTLNGEPIFTLELYWAIKDEVGKYYPFHAGDYGFHMLIAPAKQRIPNFSYYALTMCIEHFFSHAEVHRMIGEASVEHMGTHNLITKVGCEFERALVLPYKTSNLTFLTRNMYQQAVQEVLDNSCTEIFVNVS